MTVPAPADDVLGGDDMRAVDGRVPGRRGRETRRRLLEQTAEMLQSESYRELTVVEIARRSEVSPATFYQYFGDVEGAVLVIAEHVAQQGARRLADRVKQLTPVDPQTPDAARALAQEFIEVWHEYRSVLRVVDLAASEGDDRFTSLRTSLLGPPTEALVSAIGAQKGAGALPADLDAKGVAVSIICMLAHVANHQPGLEDWGGPDMDLVSSMARVITSSIVQSSS